MHEAPVVPIEISPPFAAPALFSFLAARAIPGVETATIEGDALRYARTLHLPGGPGAVELRAHQHHGVWRVQAAVESVTEADRDTALLHVRTLLDAGADPHRIDSDLRCDKRIRVLVDAAPGVRVPGAPSGDELLLRAMVGQQVSVAAARGHLTRLSDAFGTPYESGIDGLDRLFPTATQVATDLDAPADGDPLDSDRPLRLPRRNIRAVQNAAEALASGRLHLDADSSADALTEALIAEPGIGRWTAAYVVMRLRHEPDVWMTGDVALVAGARAVGILPPGRTTPQAHRELAELAQQWSPWRSYAAMHLWRAAVTYANEGNARSRHTST